MEWEVIVTLIVAAFGAGGFVQYLITRHDNKKAKNNEIMCAIEELKTALAKNERHTTRLEMLQLIQHYPTNTSEIMKVAQYYFDTLNGDWYMSSMFQQYLDEHKLCKPTWFNPEH